MQIRPLALLLSSSSNLKRPLYIWNLMIRDSTNTGLFTYTLYLYSCMLQSGVRGNNFTFPLVLKSCANINSIRDGTKVHSHSLQLGFESHVFVQTALIDMYSKCDDLLSSSKVFDQMPRRNLVSWNSIISAYCRCLLLDQAFTLLRQMRVLGFQPSSATFVIFLSSALCTLQQGLSMHCCLLKLGLLNFATSTTAIGEKGIPLANSLMSLYADYGQVQDARTFFDMMHHKSIISWTTIIGGYADSGDVAQAFSMFNRMRESIRPDLVVFIKLISACVRVGNLSLASSVHSLLLKSRLDSTDPIDNLLVSMYAKCGDLIAARRVFDATNEKSVFLWTSIIAGYTHLGYPAEALDLFKKLLQTVVKPDEATLATILSACADLGSLSMGKEIEEYIFLNGLQTAQQVQTSLIHMFCKCGNIENAKAVFERVSTKDLPAWSSMINGYAIHGMGEEALSLFHKMQKTEGIKPDASVYTSVLLACSHSGYIADGLKYFKSMQKDFGIEPSIEHYTCLVDLLGRAGQLELALKTIKQMPIKVQGQVWGPFLSACKKHRNIELGELAASKIFDSDPESIGNYVLIANLYTSAGRWKEAAVTRSVMDDRGLIKEPGCSWIEIDGVLHVFVAGDRSHDGSVEIHKKLEELNIKLLEAGYVPEIECSDPRPENGRKGGIEAP